MISVIVPVYNVEHFLNRCIESITFQTYDNLEIILVNDGSKDTSGEICDEWKHKDKRIKVIHKENGGLSSARNAGLEIATGEYIGFVDADDYINVNMYQILLDGIESMNADIMICGYEEVDTIKECSIFDEKKLENVSVMGKKEALDCIQNGIIKNYVWCRLYRKKSLKYNFYNTGWEDEVYTLQNFYTVDKIAICDTVLYYYFKRPDSITGYGIYTPITVLKSDKMCVDFCKNMNEKKLLQWRLRVSLAHMIQMYFQRVHMQDKVEERRIIKKECLKSVYQYLGYYRIQEIIKIVIFLVLNQNPYKLKKY